MTRQDEWNALLREAGETPEALPETVGQAVARAARHESRSRRARGLVGTLAALAACFVLLVNASVPFALAAGRVPILRALVSAVALDPSLKAAVAHDYVQLVKQTVKQDGVTLSVEYLVADPRNLTVFYTVTDDAGRPLTLHPSLLDADGNELPASAVYGEELAGLGQEERRDPEAVRRAQGNLCKWKFHLSGKASGQLPAEVILHAEAALDDLSDERQDLNLRFELPLTIGERFRNAVRTFPVGQTVSVLGQALTIDRLEVYPTNTRIVWRTDPENTGWLTWLPFYLTDENGVRVDGIANGVSGMAGDQSSGWGETWLESAWFDTADELTVHLDEAAVLPKAGAQVTLYADHTAEGLPDWVWLSEEERWGGMESADLWHFGVNKGAYRSNTDILYYEYTDADGKVFDTFTERSTTAHFASKTDGADFICHYGFDPDARYPLTVTLSFAPGQTLAQPVSLCASDAK